MAFGDFKDLNWRTVSEKILLDKAFNIAKNPKYDGYQRGLASMIYKFVDKNTSGNHIKSENMSDQQLAEEIPKPIIRKFKKRKVHSPFIDNIWGADLADIELTSKCNKGICFLLCVIAIYRNYALIIPLKDKIAITITSVFKKIF